MRKVTFLTAIFLLSVAWAQDSSSRHHGSSSQHSGLSDSASGKQVMRQGCLGGTPGSYVLHDDSGTDYQLTGDTSALKGQIGHVVVVHGWVTGPATASGNAEANSTSNTDRSPTTSTSKAPVIPPASAQFEVKHAGLVSNSCNGDTPR